MASGGMNLEDSQIVLGSEEGYDLECQPCCLDGKSAEAVGMCITCQEYLCQPCFDGHKLPTPMRGHKIVKKDQLMKSQISLASKDKCTELCKLHKGKVIEYHCVNHNLLGCPTCIINDHRTCDVAHIPKLAQDLDNNTMYQEVEAELLEMEQKSQNIDTLSTQRTTTLDTDSSGAIEKIQNFRKEIIQKLDKIEAELKQNVTSIKAEEMNKLLELTDQCKRAQTDLEQMIRKVESLKSGKHCCDLYVYIANIRRRLQPLSNELADVEHKLTVNDHHIDFNPETLETLKKSEAFGNVTLEKPESKIKTDVGMKASKPLSTKNVRPNIPDEDLLWALLLEETSGSCDIPYDLTEATQAALGWSKPDWDLNQGDKKENKDPQKANEKAATSSTVTVLTDTKSSTPKKSSNSLLKPPPNTVNGASQQQNVLTLDVEYPSYKDKGDKGQGAKGKDSKEFSGKQANIKVTNSQIEFFKMLDEKIEQGEDYSDFRSEASFNISTP